MRFILLFALFLVTTSPSAQENNGSSVTVAIEENLKEDGKTGLRGSQGLLKKKIKVGVVISLTGKTKELAKFPKQGYELAVEKLNQRGGVRVGSHFLEFELIFADDASDLKVAPRAAESLIKQGIQYILGPYGSALTDAVYPVCEKYKIPFITQGSALELYNPNLRYTFNPNSSGDQYLKSAVKLLGEVAIASGRKPEDLKVVIISRRDPGSKGIRAGVIETIKEWNMKLVADISVGRRDEDVRKALDKANSLLPDLIISSVQAEGARFFVREFARKKVDVPMVAMTHCDAAKLHELKPKSDYLLCSAQWDPFLNYKDHYFGSTIEYTTDYYLKYNMIPPYQAAGASTSVLLLADAIERAQTLDREVVRDKIADESVLHSIYGEIRFDEKKNKAKPIILHQLMNGEYKIVYPQNVAWARPVYPIPSWEERLAD